MSRRMAHALSTALVAALALVLLAGCGHTASTASTGPRLAAGHDGDIALSAGWVSAVADMSGMSDMPGMSGMSGNAEESTAYATLTDTGTTDDALVSVSTTAAGQATLHNTVTSANGSAGTMVAVPSVPVPAGGRVTLRPGHYHVMLTGLTTSLTAGTRISMTWTFRSGAHITTTFPVIDAADRPGTSR